MLCKDVHVSISRQMTQYNALSKGKRVQEGVEIRVENHTKETGVWIPSETLIETKNKNKKLQQTGMTHLNFLQLYKISK